MYNVYYYDNMILYTIILFDFFCPNYDKMAFIIFGAISDVLK